MNHNSSFGKRALLVLLPTVGLFASAFVLLEQPQPSAQLASYTETLPDSVVTISMVQIPGGSVAIGGKQVDVKPFWIASTETPWEAFDAFLASGPPSPPYDQTAFAPDAVARPSKSYILPDLGWGHHGFPAIEYQLYFGADALPVACRRY